MAEGAVLANGPCWVCKNRFEYDPDTVPSVFIDPVLGLPPDLGGDPQRARREPIGPCCLPRINQIRAGRGLPTIDEG